MKSISPTPTLPHREGVADKMSRHPGFHMDNIIPSLWGRVGVGLLSLILCGCITEYEAKVDEVADILVVEGIITDDETVITLSRSTNLNDEDGRHWTSTNYVTNAVVHVECEDGTQFRADLFCDYDSYGRMHCQYNIKTGTLNLERKYHLKIEIEGYEYSSDYSYPIKTPEIDSIFWRKRNHGQPVMIYVSTQDPNVLYYRWSFKEDWEYHSNVYLDGYPYQCWDTSSSYGMVIGSAEQTVIGKMTDVLVEIDPSSRKLSQLYRINIKQNAISKRSYDYFANIKKNSEQSGSIFAPIPSELRGNIICTTDPDRPVIGYVDVSLTTRNLRYIPYRERAYEPPRWTPDCEIYTKEEICDVFGKFCKGPVELGEWVIYDSRAEPPTYVQIQCVDCTFGEGATQKPDDWPNNY